MTLFVNLRGSSYGSVCDPYVLQGDPFADDSPRMSVVPWAGLDGIFANRDVILVTHGFNVNYVDGLRSLDRLGTTLDLASPALFVGVLWPGDWVVPAVNYPFSVRIARLAGQNLGDFCNRWLARARSVGFVSHSLGARVILEAALRMKRRTGLLCIAAGAVNDDCLSAEYGADDDCADAIQNLASRCDDVLKLAYPVGDVIAEILHDDHRLLHAALGRSGPRPCPVKVRPFQIPDSQGYGHGNYLPPSDRTLQPGSDGRWLNVAQFIKEAVANKTHAWPT